MFEYIRKVPIGSFLTEWDGVAEIEYANVFGSQIELPDTIEQEDAQEYEWSEDEPPF